MSNLTNNQKYYSYLVFTIGFFLLLLYAILNTIKIYKTKQTQGHRGSIHIFIVIATCVCIADDVSRVIYAQQLLSPLYGLCNFPYVMTWYFIFTAYLFALERWISMYQSVTPSIEWYAPKIRISFVVGDLILFTLLITSGAFYCEEIGLYAGSNRGHIIYIISIVLTALLVSTLFAVYGFRIANRLFEGLTMKVASKHDRTVYLVTRQTAAISATSAAGALLAIIFSVLEEKNLIFGDIARIIQMFFELLVMFQLLYVVRPKPPKRKLATESTEKSLANISTMPTPRLQESLNVTTGSM